MILAVGALLLPAAAVWIWLDVLRGRAALGSRAVAAAVAFALGLGLSSISTTWLLIAGVPGGLPLALIDGAIWLALGALGWWLRGAGDWGLETGGWGPIPDPQSPIPDPRSLILARIGFAVVVALAVATAIGEYTGSPHGQWDAWVMWNQKARFITRGGTSWTDMLALPWAQPAHPLLVSASVARLWSYAGAELTAVPALIAFLMGASIVAGVIGALDPSRPLAWLAGAVLLAPATFIREVMSQQADVPIAMFMVLTAVVIKKDRPHEWRSGGWARASLLVAGTLAGLAAWTKNEGILFVAIATLLIAWVAVRHAGRRPVPWWFAGLAPGLLTVIGFKRLIPSTPLYLSETATPAAMLQRATEIDVHALIARTIGARWHEWGGPLTDGALPLALGCGVVWALRPSGHSARAAAGAGILMLAAYYLVWVLSPLETVWLVDTTFDRLVAQLWPLFVLAAFSWPHPAAHRATHAETH
jgi:hypothetical protein